MSQLHMYRFVAIILKMKLDFLTEIRMHLGATHFIRPGINIFPTRSLSNHYLTKTTSIMVQMNVSTFVINIIERFTVC